MPYHDQHEIEWGAIAGMHGLDDASQLKPGDRLDGPDRAARRRSYEPGCLRYITYTECYRAVLRHRRIRTDPRTRLILELEIRP